MSATEPALKSTRTSRVERNRSTSRLSTLPSTGSMTAYGASGASVPRRDARQRRKVTFDDEDEQSAEAQQQAAQAEAQAQAVYMIAKIIWCSFTFSFEEGCF